MNQSANDLLMGGSRTPPASFETVGTVVKGEVSELDTGQQRDYVTKQPLFWGPDRRPTTTVTNDPVMQTIITVQTDERDQAIEDDDGRRRIYAGGRNIRQAIVDAIRNAGANGIEIGGKLAVKYVSGSGNTGDPKVYEAQYKDKLPNPTAVTAADLLEEPF